jgi:CO dehydrogenase maturation factor
MKISVCGKGGSGKSAIVTLLANGARDRGYQVLVVDSDESNSGLYRMLGFETPPVPLMELVGGKRSLRQKMSQPQILAEAEIWLRDIPSEHMLEKDGIRLVAIGKILQSLEGCACPMGVLSREFLKKLRLKHKEITIVDMEAGVEHFGRGVETSVDNVLIVVEPSMESITLAERVNNLAGGSGVSNTLAVLNKITSRGMASKLREELSQRGVRVIGAICNDPDIFEACFEGRPLYGDKAAREIGKVLDFLLSEIRMNDEGKQAA